MDKSGNIWIGGLAGMGGSSVGVYNGNTVAYLSPENKLAQFTVNSFCLDSKGNLWVGTGKGIFFYDYVTSDEVTYTMDDGLVSNGVKCIAEDKQGNMWFGTDQGVSMFDGTTWKKFLQSEDGLINQ